MKKLLFSPDYKEKTISLRERLKIEFGADVCKRVMSRISTDVKILKTYDRAGHSVREEFGIDTDYYYMYTCHNYVFYRIEDDSVFIVNIYHEHEDFMWKLFGIRETSDTMDDYWDI